LPFAVLAPGDHSGNFWVHPRISTTNGFVNLKNSTLYHFRTHTEYKILNVNLLQHRLSHSQCKGKGKDKGKDKIVPALFLTEHHAMKAYWGSGGIAPLVL
jgi:hypothetical protein